MFYQQTTQVFFYFHIPSTRTNYWIALDFLRAIKNNSEVNGGERNRETKFKLPLPDQLEVKGWSFLVDILCACEKLHSFPILWIQSEAISKCFDNSWPPLLIWRRVRGVWIYSSGFWWISAPIMTMIWPKWIQNSQITAKITSSLYRQHVHRFHSCFLQQRLPRKLRPSNPRKKDTSIQTQQRYLTIHPVIAEALRQNRPVVALESTIITHGMPCPDNIK